MRKKLCGALVALLILIALAPAQAGTWRSTTGNMFHFYPGGAMEAYIQGNVYNGRWWWTRNPYQFQYNFGYKTITVNVKGQGAIALEPGRNPSYWSMIARRGSEEKRPDTTSWFMEQVDP